MWRGLGRSTKDSMPSQVVVPFLPAAEQSSRVGYRWGTYHFLSIS